MFPYNKNCKIPDLQIPINGGLIFQHGQDILLCGGKAPDVENIEICWKMESDRWVQFNEMIDKRVDSAVVQMINESYVIGGTYH